MTQENNTVLQKVKDALKIQVSGGFGKSKKRTASSSSINEAIKSISDKISLYEKNNNQENKKDLLAEIKRYLGLAETKIKNNTRKNKLEFATHPNFAKDTEIMLRQMKTLVSYGQELSGDPNFGKKSIDDVTTALKTSNNNLIHVTDEIKAIKNNEKLFQASLTSDEKKQLKVILKSINKGVTPEYPPGLRKKLQDSFIQIKNSLESLSPTQKKALSPELKAYVNLLEEWENVSLGRKLYSVLKAGDTQAFTNIMTAMSPSSPDNITGPAQGPIQKNESTLLLEAMIKSLLKDNAQHAKDNTKPARFEISNGNQMVATFNGENYDMSKILKHANFNQLNLSDEEIAAYEKFLRKGNNAYQPQVAASGHEELMKQADIPDNAVVTGKHQGMSVPVIRDIDHLEKLFEAKDKEGKLANLSLAEKLALNIYTSQAFKEINPLMRGQIQTLADKDTSPERLSELLLISAIGVHGLNRISDSVPISTIRIDEELPETILEARKDAAKNKSVIVDSAFISTASGAPVESFFNNFAKNQPPEGKAVAATVFTGLTGKDVSSLGFFSFEKNEYLGTPTQLQVQEVQEIEGRHYFLVTPVITPEGLHPHTEEDLLFFEENKNSHTQHIIETTIPELEAAPILNVETNPQNNRSPKPGEYILNSIEKMQQEFQDILNDFEELKQKMGDLTQTKSTWISARPTVPKLIMPPLPPIPIPKEKIASKKNDGPKDEKNDDNITPTRFT